MQQTLLEVFLSFLWGKIIHLTFILCYKVDLFVQSHKPIVTGIEKCYFAVTIN